jgi:hypothetical protein
LQSAHKKRENISKPNIKKQQWIKCKAHANHYKPMKTHMRTMAVISPPRLEGDKKPSNANIIVTSVIAKIIVSSDGSTFALLFFFEVNICSFKSSYKRHEK